MGYYTLYKVSCNDEERLDEVLEAVSKQSEETTDCLTGEGDSTKWYDYHEDMLKISILFPDLVLRLDGNGDSSCDIWVCWYKNGMTRGWQLEPSVPEGFDPPGGW